MRVLYRLVNGLFEILMFTRSQAAARLSVVTLCKEAVEVYHWTTTFPEVTLPAVAFKKFSRLQKILVRAGISGVRVCEWHPGGHGCHFHFETTTRIDIRVMRRWSRRCGFGRIHVRRIDKKRLEYLLKDVAPGQFRVTALKGRRLWAAFGNDKRKWACRCKDVVVRSPVLDLFRRLRVAKEICLGRSLKWYEMQILMDESVCGYVGGLRA